MLNMLLVYDFWNDYFLTWPRLIGFSVIVIGIVLALSAKRIARIATKQETVEKGDPLFTKILTFALVFILAGMIIAIL